MKNNYTHCLTLRLDHELDDLLTEAAYDYTMSKSSWIRASLRQSLGIAGLRQVSGHGRIANAGRII